MNFFGLGKKSEEMDNIETERSRLEGLDLIQIDRELKNVISVMKKLVEKNIFSSNERPVGYMIFLGKEDEYKSLETRRNQLAKYKNVMKNK